MPATKNLIRYRWNKGSQKRLPNWFRTRIDNHHAACTGGRDAMHRVSTEGTQLLCLNLPGKHINRLLNPANCFFLAKQSRNIKNMRSELAANQHHTEGK